MISVPFAYNEHACPTTTAAGPRSGGRADADALEVVEVRKEGLAGSLLGALWLNWIEQRSGAAARSSCCARSLFPLWILYCGAVNAWRARSTRSTGPAPST